MAKVNKNKNLLLLFFLIAVVLLSLYLANKKLNFDMGSDAYSPREFRKGYLKVSPSPIVTSVPSGFKKSPVPKTIDVAPPGYNY